MQILTLPLFLSLPLYPKYALTAAYSHGIAI